MAPAASSPWNIANIVTLARIALVPFFAWALLIDGGSDPRYRLLATAIFVLAAATDRLDGYLARRYALVTDLGKLLDPIADKALVGVALILLAWPLGELPWWVPGVILIRELGITLMRMSMLKYEVMPASRGGKIKTVVQIIAISLFVLPLQEMPLVVTWLAWVAMAVAMGITVMTGIDYVRQGWRIRSQSRRLR